MTSVGGGSEVIYTEPARSYRSAWWLGTALVAGFVIDIALGGANAHLWAWLAALVIVVGADVLVIRAANATRSVRVTASEIRVGDEVASRASIVGIADDLDARMMGRRPGERMPPGVDGLTLELADGVLVVVPTRHPQALRAALEVGVVAPEVRPAEDGELDDLEELERRSNTLFTVAGLGPMPDPGPAHATIREARAVFVAGRPAVGFARIDEIDGQAHLAQVSVLPSHMRRGIGTSLVRAAVDWAREHGYQAMTVSTFADVPWTVPFYARSGFAPVEGLTPGLAELRDWERDIGLDSVGRRIVMRRELA